MCRISQNSRKSCGRFGLYREGGGCHSDCGLEEPARQKRQLTKKRSSPCRMARGSDPLSLTDLYPGRCQQDQSLEEKAMLGALFRSMPYRLPSLMSFPVIAVIEKVDSPSEHV